jgi:hypothetical protein
MATAKRCQAVPPKPDVRRGLQGWAALGAAAYPPSPGTRCAGNGGGASSGARPPGPQSPRKSALPQRRGLAGHMPSPVTKARLSYSLFFTYRVPGFHQLGIHIIAVPVIVYGVVITTIV